MPLLLILFIAVPILEIYLLLEVGEVIGALPTVAAVVGTAVLGAALVRRQGFATLGKVQGMLARGEMPAVPIFEGMAILVAGALLLTPGFFTDAVGFAALVPPLRRHLIRRLLARGVMRAVHQGGGPAPGASSAPDAGQALEGEYRRVDDGK